MQQKVKKPSCETNQWPWYKNDVVIEAGYLTTVTGKCPMTDLCHYRKTYIPYQILYRYIDIARLAYKYSLVTYHQRSLMLPYILQKSNITHLGPIIFNVRGCSWLGKVSAYFYSFLSFVSLRREAGLLYFQLLNVSFD